MKKNAGRTIMLPCPLRVRVSREDEKRIEDMAGRTGTTTSEALRQLIRRGRVVPGADIRKMLMEMNKIGVNLNQIAKIGNQRGFILADLPQSLAELRLALGEIRKCL